MSTTHGSWAASPALSAVVVRQLPSDRRQMCCAEAVCGRKPNGQEDLAADGQGDLRDIRLDRRGGESSCRAIVSRWPSRGGFAWLAVVHPRIFPAQLVRWPLHCWAVALHWPKGGCAVSQF